MLPRDGDWTRPAAALAALGTLAWGGWVFVFEQILLPAAAPVNITLGLQISRLHQPADGTSPIPVVLEASAKNASPKMLLIPKTFLVAHAQKLRQKVDGLIEEEKLIQDVNRQMALKGEDRSLKGAASTYQSSDDRWDVVAFGPLFDASNIRPQEEIKARRLLFVPPGKDYDLLRVKVVIPSYSRSTWLADDDLIRVTGGIMYPSKDFVGVGFCQAERGLEKHGLRWWFDKFLLPRDRFDDNQFQAPAIRYCPTGLTQEERERIGAQVFTSTYEIDLTASAQAPSEGATP